MNPSWISKERVLELTGWSATWFKQQVRTGAIEARETDQRGRNGKLIKEYSVASLPEAARAKLGGGDASQTKAELVTVAHHTPLFAAHAISPSTTRVVLVDPKDQEKAAKRLAIIQPLLEYRAASPESSTRTRYQQLRVADGRAITTVDLLALYLSQQHKVSIASIYRWVSAYAKKGGEVALADKRRADKGQSRFAKKNVELGVIAAHCALDPSGPKSAKVTHEEVCRYADAHGIEPPCYESVRIFMKHRIPPALRTLAIEGKQKYAEIFSPYMERGYTDIGSNEIWVSDHAISDVLVQNDIFGTRDLQPMRMHMTTLLDLRSRYIVGVSWSQNGSSRSIVTAFRHAIEAHGMPEGFYCDNGKDYRKFAKEAQQYELDERALVASQLPQTRDLLDDGKGGGVLARFGIPVTYCIPYAPQSKPIERYHRTFHERFDKSFFPYTGGKPELRPDRTHAAAGHHHNLLMLRKKGIVDSMQVARASALPLASGYIAAFMQWVSEWYHVTPQRGRGMNGRSPAEVFHAERRKPIIPAPPPDQMAAFLLERKRVKVDSCAVRLLGQRYVHTPGDDTAKNIMHDITTRHVYVAYDPCDTERVAVLNSDGYILCWLQPQILMRQSGDEETHGLIAESMADRRGLMKATYQANDALSRAYASTGHKTQAEHLREVARLPLASGDTITQRPQHIDLRPSADSHAPESASQIARSILGGLNGN
jgi:transposase InsO family protein